MFSPLEQFGLGVISIYRTSFVHDNIGFFISKFIGWLTITNLVLFGFLLTLLICGISYNASSRMKVIPTPLQYIFELIYKFLSSTLIQQAGYEAIFFLPIVMTLFLFILIANLMGLANWSYTITAHLIITFFLALSINFGLLIYGLIKKRFQFFKMFNPPGVPLLLRPLTIAIEIFSYILRNFSLPIRLFANMLAGHILLAIIGSSFVAIVAHISYPEVSLILLILDSCIILAIILLEFAVACIQAYVFTVLAVIYLRDSLSVSH